MNRIYLIGSILLASGFAQSSFAYTHISNGKGITCDLQVSAAPQILHGCPVRVVSEHSVYESFKDINGNRILNTERLTDSRECLSARTLVTAKGDADMAQNQTLNLSFALFYVSASAETAYKNSNGTVDPVAHPGISEYVTYSPTVQAEAADKALISAVTNELVQSATVQYDANAHTLTLNTFGRFGNTRASVSADFSKGAVAHSIPFALPALVNVDEARPARVFSARLTCSPQF